MKNIKYLVLLTFLAPIGCGFALSNQDGSTEVSQKRIDPDGKTWQNDTTVKTHGKASDVSAGIPFSAGGGYGADPYGYGGYAPGMVNPTGTFYRPVVAATPVLSMVAMDYVPSGALPVGTGVGTNVNGRLNKIEQRQDAAAAVIKRTVPLNKALCQSELLDDEAKVACRKYLRGE